MSVSSAIGNLQQALDCAGKCDCCNKLQQQINDLSQRLNLYIPKSEKPQIINESVQKSYNFIIPEANGYTDTKVGALETAIAAVRAFVDYEIGQLKQTIETFRQLLDSLRMLVESFFNTIAKLLSLPGRVTTLEGGLDAIRAELNKIYSLIQGVKNTAENAKATADTALSNSELALDRSVTAQATADTARREVKELEGFTKSALERLQALIERSIKQVNSRIDGLNKTINEIISSLGQTINRLVRLEGIVSKNTSDIETHTGQISKNTADIASNTSRIVTVEKTAATALGLSSQALQEADAADSKAREAQQTADEAIYGARNASKKADEAIGKANEAVKTANGIKGELESKITQLRNYFQGKINELSNQIFGLNLVASTALSTAQTAAATGQQALQKGVQLEQTKQDKGSFPVNDLDKKFNDFVNANNKSLNIRDLQQSQLSKDFDKRFTDFQRLSNLDANQRFNEFQNQNKQALNIRDLGVSNLSKEFNQRFVDFERLSNLDNNTRFDEFVKTNNTSLDRLKNKDTVTDDRLRKLENPNTNPALEELRNKIKERENVDKSVLDRLDKIVPIIALIPGITSNVKLFTPTLPQINAEVGNAVCKTFNGGCGTKALDKQTGDINRAANANKANILDKLNAGANTAQLAALNVINNKLGAQIPGGIGGKLVDGFKWLHLDRILNVLIFAATVQNHLMLSNDIGQTLLGAFNNILQLIGIKDDKGQAINVGEVIGNTIENVIKGIVGAENYATLSVQWAKANRIYQASTNILNSFQGLASSILNGLELVAGQNGKIGNALKKAGQVLDDAYGWMNPQPKINRITNFLEGLQQGSSTIQQVTQVPLDIISQTTELTNSSTELIKAWKEDDKPANKAAPIPEPDKLKADEATAAAASAGKETSETDLEADE